MKTPIRPIHGKINNNHEQVMDRTHDILNGGIDLGSQNFSGGASVPGNINATHVVAVSPGTSNTDYTVTHNLNRIPTGFIVVNIDQQATIWRGSVAWNNTTITLRASLATVTATLLIY